MINQKNKSYKVFVYLLILVMMLHACLVPALAVVADGEAPRLINGEIYYIKNKNSGQYLMVEGSGTSAFAQDNVIQTKKRQTGVYNDRQKWRLDYMGNGEYRIVSMLSSTDSMLVLDVFANDNTNGSNIDIYYDADSTDRRWKILLNSDNCTYRILSKCSNYTKGVGVENASCTDEENVAQYQYNTNSECEWIFEPVYNYSTVLGVNYALTNWNSYLCTYPGLNGRMGADCANFVSQCMLAGGIHFQDEWWIWKKNNNYLLPNSSIQFNNSWDVTTIGDGLLGWGDSSPWISARKFCDFWSARVEYQDFSAEDILADPAVVYDQPYYQGDVISVINSSGEAEHTMYISGYGIYNREATYFLTYHSENREFISLLEVVAMFATQGDYEYRFYKMN